MTNQFRASWLNLEPAASTLIDERHVPGPDDLLTSAKSLVLSRRGAHEKPSPEDDFANKTLATHSAFFFRKALSPLRSFLWRLLQSGYVLEVRSADLTRSKDDERAAETILRFNFPSPIIPGLVAFADHPHDAELNDIYAFLITEDRQFYTLRIDPQDFQNATIPQKAVLEWCYLDAPTTLTVNDPYRLCAPNPFEVFVAYRNSVLARLRRPKDWNRLRWTQDVFDNRSWMSSFWDRDATFKYEGNIYSRNAPSAMEPSSDQQFVFTVCLDHTLKIWNQATGKIVSEMGLISGNAPQPTPVKPPMNPSSSSFVRSFYLGNGQYSLITFAPNEDSQFKFWDISGGLTTPVVVRDRFPKAVFRPPDPDPLGNSVWSLNGLEISQDENQQPHEIWVLWRSNNLYKLYSIKTDFSDPQTGWDNGWLQTCFSSLSDDAPPDPVPSRLVDTTERWYQFLLTPGRFDRSVLEASLTIYQAALNLKRLKVRKEASLQERLCASIASNVTLRRYDEADADYDQFFADTDAQWRQIWRIARNIQAQMRTPLSLSFDKLAGMPWIAMAGHGCTIRECSTIEKACLNDGGSIENAPIMAKARSRGRRSDPSPEVSGGNCSKLIRAASIMRQKIPPELFNSIENALLAEIYQEIEKSAPARLADFYNSTNMNFDLPDEAYEATLEALESLGGPSSIDNELFMATLDLLPNDRETKRSSLRYTQLGLKLITGGATDVICLCRQVLFNICCLIIFLEYELDRDEMRPVDLDAAELFAHSIGIFKDYEKRAWLTKHTRERSTGPSSVAASSEPTILEDIFAMDVWPQPVVHCPQRSLITQSINDLVIWSAGAPDSQTDDTFVYILCNLVANDEIDLAGDFLRFQSNTPWAAYGKGRAYLAQRNFDAASYHFRKSSYYLARGKANVPVDIASAGLLSALESNSFFNGLPRYYQHIVALFETAKAYSHVADFARLALHSLLTSQSTSEALKSDLLSRLFTAELQLYNFTSAFAAISQFTDKALQKSSMSRLVRSIISMIAAGSGGAQGLATLGSLPVGQISTLANVVDDTLHDLAIKQTSIPDAIDTCPLRPHAIDYMKLLYTYRLQHNNFRGAVSILLERLSLIKRTGRARSDPQATELRHAYLLLINTLASVAPEDAYVLSEVPVSETSGAGGKQRRIVVTLEDLRRDYQALLDRCSRIERGDYEFFVDEQDLEGSEVEDEWDSPRAANGRDVALMSGAMDIS